MIELYTLDGRLVHSQRDAVIEVMGANGRAPEVLIWGERVFVRQEPDGYRPGVLPYREGILWPLHTGEALEIPLHTVDGLLAGKTTLLTSRDVVIPRAETAGSDEPDTEKVTESYKPPEFANDGERLAWMGTDAARWAALFVQTFQGIAVGGMKIDEGTMIGWFASAIETGRSAGQSSLLARLGEEDPVATELAELKQLFDLQQKRMEAATLMWRMEKPHERYGVLPDLGDLLQWLMDRIRHWIREARQAEELAAQDVNTILSGAPQSWDGDEAASHIAIQYVRELERRLDAAGISRERYPEPYFLGHLGDGLDNPPVLCRCGQRFHGFSLEESYRVASLHCESGKCPVVKSHGS